MASNSLEIRRVTPAIGAEILGVDLAVDLSEQTFEAIREAWHEHLVLFFRGQELSVAQLASFGERFGPLHVHPQGDKAGHPGVLEIHTDASSKVYAGRDWHSDVSCDEEPPAASILCLNVVPECGGDTMFSNMYAAYDALSSPMKKLLDGLSALHGSERNYRGYFGQQPDEMRDGEYPESVHPVVRTHPETGRKALFVNALFTEHIVDVTESESEALLGFLYRHVAEPRFQCRFKWEKDSIAIWDNRCSMHRALWDYHPQTRSGYRVTVLGDRPV